MIKLLQGDCLELMKDIKDKSIDLILCDLPYGITASTWDKLIPMTALWDQYNRILKSTGTVLLFASGLFTPRVMCSNLDCYKYRLVWVKSHSTNFVHAKNRPMTKSEDILVFSNGAMGHTSQLGDKRMTYNPQGLVPLNKVIKNSENKFGTIAGKSTSNKRETIREYTNYPTDVLFGFNELPSNKRLHTNEKPVALLEYLIKTYTNDGETVMDNCMGSGSCGVACVNTNRNFIGMELDKTYFDIAKQRIENETN